MQESEADGTMCQEAVGGLAVPCGLAQFSQTVDLWPSRPTSANLGLTSCDLWLTSANLWPPQPTFGLLSRPRANLRRPLASLANLR